MIDGVPECLAWPGNHGRAKARRGEVNPKPKICCGRYISRTHCHRDAAVESASEERQLGRRRKSKRESGRQREIEMPSTFKLKCRFGWR